MKYFNAGFWRLAADGVTPWKRVNALVKLSGVSKPYFKAVSMTFAPDSARSFPASDSRRERI